jgi:hypothetical protein
VIIDGDSHIFEPRTMWREYCDPCDRDVALQIEDDALSPRLNLLEEHRFAGLPGALSYITRPSRTPKPPSTSDLGPGHPISHTGLLAGPRCSSGTPRRRRLGGRVDGHLAVAEIRSHSPLLRWGAGLSSRGVKQRPPLH